MCGALKSYTESEPLHSDEGKRPVNDCSSNCDFFGLGQDNTQTCPETDVRGLHASARALNEMSLRKFHRGLGQRVAARQESFQVARQVNYTRSVVILYGTRCVGGN